MKPLKAAGQVGVLLEREIEEAYLEFCPKKIYFGRCDQSFGVDACKEELENLLATVVLVR